MDSLAFNKVAAAVLVAGITFMVAGLVGEQLVHPVRLTKSAITIEGVPAAGGAPVVEPPLTPIGPLLASADPAAGEAETKKLCVSCHTFTNGGKDGVGPNLYGVVGGPHAHRPDFSYSAGMKAKEGPWTFDELNEWLHKPSSYVPGTRMAFAGISNDKQRADVIAYLRSLSPNPVPLPAAAPADAAAPAAAAPPATPPAGAAPAAAPAAPAPAPSK